MLKNNINMNIFFDYDKLPYNKVRVNNIKIRYKDELLKLKNMSIKDLEVKRWSKISVKNGNKVDEFLILHFDSQEMDYLDFIMGVKGYLIIKIEDFFETGKLNITNEDSIIYGLCIKEE